ncbi:DUF87 domain-containing protein [Xanthobacter sp. V4C-4]|uniref:ATP-binding protein n=1 Tax=Xanthobacter cornucopiae TaxID=3119924 RepID=UPI00372B7AE4
MTAELAALQEHRFDWVHSLDSVWTDSRLHVDALHAAERARILTAFGDAEKSLEHAPATGSPPGLFLVGGKGLGKTHLLGSVRREVWQRGGYFFLVELLDGQAFWQCVVNAYATGLVRELPRGRRQAGSRIQPTEPVRQVDLWAHRFALRLGHRPEDGEYNFLVGRHYDAQLVGVLITRLRAPRPGGLRLPGGALGIAISDMLRALLLLKSRHEQAAYGEMLLLGVPLDPEDRRALGFMSESIDAQTCVTALSWLLGQTGASLVAFDQLDVLLDTLAVMKKPDQLAQISHGLMGMKEHTTATLTLVSCFPETMEYIERKTVGAAKDRFRALPVTLSRRIDGPVAEDIVARRLAPGYARIGFRPPFATWPIAASAFADGDLPSFTPRELISEVAQHVGLCIEAGAARVLASFRKPEERQSPAGSADDARTKREGNGRGETETTRADADLSRLDALFDSLRAAAPANALDPRTENTAVPDLLRAGLEAWINERPDHSAYALETDFGTGAPALHARLRRALSEQSEAEESWAFRAIGASHHAAVRAALRHAAGASGIGLLKELRHLVILRNAAWPNGAATAKAVAALTTDGAEVRPLDAGDMQVLSALQQMLDAKPAGLVRWLRARRPTRRIRLFADCLPADDTATRTTPSMPTQSPTQGQRESVQAGSDPDVADRPAHAPAAPPETPNPAALPIGYRGAPEQGGPPVALPLPRLRQHAAVFAGSGSGKTVLLRRIIEEAALRGISSIVLDTNNDLARLGEAWPAPPRGWVPGDAARARRLLDETDVVIWTPGRADGRALNLRPLPDFGSIADDRFELQQAVDMATATLAPLAGCDGPSPNAQRARAVLKSAIELFARSGGEALSSFIGLLAALPETLSDIRNAPNIAAGLADNLLAQCKLNVLLRDQGDPLDPGLLLAPAGGRSARVSVISFVGLPDADVRQSFVNQLHMALFAWLKKHPAQGPLGGLYVMDEAQNFAPSGQATPCRQSTISLVSQARKYGLGMVFATQAPKGIHNAISGNCLTQFFGRLNHPTQIEAAKELAAARGGRVNDISTLSTGEFYASSEDLPVTRLRMPNCLTHHPAAPPSDDEVLARARAARAAATNETPPAAEPLPRRTRRG